jgi:hypothetical protein
LRIEREGRDPDPERHRVIGDLRALLQLLSDGLVAGGGTGVVERRLAWSRDELGLAADPRHLHLGQRTCLSGAGLGVAVCPPCPDGGEAFRDLVVVGALAE